MLEKITVGPQHSIQLSQGVATQTIWWCFHILMMYWRAMEGEVVPVDASYAFMTRSMLTLHAILFANAAVW